MKYPQAAGFKEETTSREAAEKIETSGRAGTLRARVKDCFDMGAHCTADEIADCIGESPLAVRPRLSELRAGGYITTTGERRRSSIGRNAHVWRKA